MRLILLTLLLTGCCNDSPQPSQRTSQSQDQYNERFRESGRKAFRAGVPATANPHQGGSFAQEWLDGWVEEQERKKK